MQYFNVCLALCWLLACFYNIQPCCSQNEELPEKTVAIARGLYVGSVVRWVSNFDSDPNELKRALEVLESLTISTHRMNGINGDMRATLIDFMINQLFNYGGSIGTHCTYIFNTELLKTYLPALLESSDLTWFSFWITRQFNMTNYGLAYGVNVLEIHHIGAVRYRIIRCGGFVYDEGDYVPWDSDYSNKSSEKFIELQHHAEQSFRSRMIMTPLLHATSSIELYECTWKVRLSFSLSIWKTYCHAIIHYDYEILMSEGGRFVGHDGLPRIAQILNDVRENTDISGFRNVEIDELRSPWNSSETKLRLGGLLMENDHVVIWNAAFRDGQSPQFIRAAERVMETMQRAIHASAFAPIPHRLLDISFNRKSGIVYTFVGLIVDAQHFADHFSFGMKIQTTKIIESINEALSAVPEKALLSVERSY